MHMSNMKKITIVTGHYGTGKTNYSVNLALEAARTGEPVSIVDLDIVNPYFRTADFGRLFAEHGVTMITPDYANSNVDIPVLNFDLERIASDPGYLDMLYVINCYRYLTKTPQEALTMMYEIEQASHMKHTGIVNNSNLGCETTVAHIESSLPFAQELARQADLPLLYTTYDDRLSPSGVGLHPVHVHVRPIWD